MIYQKPDGTIEIESHGCCCPPGTSRPGMHTNSSTYWVRFNGGPWIKLERLAMAREFAACAATCLECRCEMIDAELIAH